MNNPLLDFTDLIDFANLKPEHMLPALQSRIADAKNTLLKVTDPATPATWEDVVEPLDRSTMLLSRTWGAISHLAGVEDSPELRRVYNEALPLMTAFSIELSQSTLYLKYEAISKSTDFLRLTPTRRRIITQALKDFRNEGAFLDQGKKEELKKVKTELSSLSQKFSENLLDATNAFEIVLSDSSRLKGIPDDSIAYFKESAKAAGKDGYRITLQAPSYLAVIRYADDRNLREEVYRARASRASELDDDARFDNTPVMKRILELRLEEARLLGYKNYAELSISEKMADSPEEVISFLRNLASRSRPKAKADFDELIAFAKNNLHIDEPKNWDYAYAAEKLREAKYAYSDDEVKRYFTLDAVFSGLFGLVEFFFDIRIVPDSAPVWNPDVKFFKIENKKGEKVAQFYVDLYSRESKRGGAWMDNERVRNRLFGGLQTPIAYLCTNFMKPAEGQKSLLTHDEVQTLFHEFGHGLQHMLSKVDDPDASGINGVEWDAVECPSQFMENFTYDKRVLKRLTAHEKTGKPISDELIDKIIAAKNFESGMAMVRQLEFGLFDMLLHTDFDPEKDDIRTLLDSVRKEVAVVSQPDFDRFANSFSHIFAGGYAAGYYSYKWAEVLSCDAFGLFEEHGVLDYATGQKWLHEVLETGSSRPSMDSFVAFRGRKPKIDALLRLSGITK